MGEIKKMNQIFKTVRWKMQMTGDLILQMEFMSISFYNIRSNELKNVEIYNIL